LDRAAVVVLPLFLSEPESVVGVKKLLGFYLLSESAAVDFLLRAEGRFTDVIEANEASELGRGALCVL